MLIAEAEWQAIMERASLPTFRPALDRLHAEAADLLARPVAVQAQPGGYYHDFFCPEHGVQLLFDPASPMVHRCPVDGALVQGERFAAAWRWFVNNRLAEGAIRLAVLGRLTENADYLHWVADVLRQYARQYPNYQQVKRNAPNPGVATYTTLDESVWVLPLAWAFDLIRDELTPEESEQISQRLFGPVADHLVAHHFRGIHNFSCWHNAAIGTIGVVINRADLLDFAIHSEYGFETQVREGVLADGLWFEGSFSYHFYTLAALIALVKATRHLPGLDLRDRPALRAMFRAPIESAYPDWTMPATNDCWYFTSLLADCCHGVPPAPAFYEVGYAWYRDPLFAQVLQRAYAQSPRATLDALLFGVTALLPIAPEPLPSVNLAASGYAILRTQPDAAPTTSDQQRYLLLKYGPHGEGHGHPDKLNLILYAYGQRLSPDLGTPGYGLDLFESWYRQTVSHNTVTIDGLSQPPATGQLHAFQGDGPFQVADASVTWQNDETVVPATYRGVTMHRVILARPTYFLDLVLVKTQHPQQMDWIYHNTGAVTTTLAFATASAVAGEGYQHIAHPQHALVQGEFALTWQTVGGSVAFFSAGTTGDEVIIGQTPGNPPTDLRTVLIQRRRGMSTAYCGLFHPHDKTPAVTAVEWLGQDMLATGWAGCVVHCQGRRERWLMRLGATQVPPALPSNFAVDAQFEYTVDWAGE